MKNKKSISTDTMEKEPVQQEKTSILTPVDDNVNKSNIKCYAFFFILIDSF